jgi:tetratricopeptide (TPR) repeat protein
MRRDYGPDTKLDSKTFGQLQETVARFRTALRRGDRPEVEAFVSADEPRRSLFVAELVHEEFEHRIRSGEEVSLESFLERFPELLSKPTVIKEMEEAIIFWRTPRRFAGEARDGRPTGLPIGRYELREVIGRGACGVIYRAWDTALGRDVALKRPTTGALSLPGGIERFLHEARSTAGLRHPNIVPVHDVGTWDGEPYLVTALVEGRNLAQELSEKRPSFRQSAEWAASLADALAHAHQHGVIHRDVKPSNVLIDRDNHVILTDFGLAKSQEEKAALTDSGQLIGTPAYMSPEQAGARHVRIDGRADVYSLGVILYELMTGVRPFVGTERMVLARIREEEPRPPRRLDDTIPRELETVCLKAMAKEPGNRYADAMSLGNDLRRWLHGEPVLARPVGRVGMLWRRCRRKPALSGLAASLVLAVIMGFIGVTREWRRAESFRRRAESNFAVAEQQRQRATQALAQGRHTLETLNRLVIRGQLGRLEPQSIQELSGLLFEQYRAYRGEPRDDLLMRLDLADSAFHIACLLEGKASLRETRAAWKEAHDLHEGLARDAPTDILILSRFGNCLLKQSDFLRRIGRNEEGKAFVVRAREQLRRNSALAETLVAQGPGNPVMRRILAECDLALAGAERSLGQIPDAIAASRRSRDRAEANLRCGLAEEEEVARLILLDALVQLVELLPQTGSSEAVAEARRYSERIESLVENNSSPLSEPAGAARRYFFMAASEDRLNRTAAANRHFRHAAGLFESLDRAGSLTATDRVILGTCYHVIARLHVENGRPGEALEPYHKAAAIREGLIQAEPGNLRHRLDCSGSWHRLAEALENLGRYEEARSALQKALVLRRRLVAEAPAEMEYRRGFDELLCDLARWSRKAGRSAEMLAAVRERKALWPNDPAVAFSAACDLAAAALLPRPGEALINAILNHDRRSYALEALAAMRDAARLTARDPRLKCIAPSTLPSIT